MEAEGLMGTSGIYGAGHATDHRIPGTNLRTWTDPTDGRLHVTGPCGQRHSMDKAEADALGRWLTAWANLSQIAGVSEHAARKSPNMTVYPEASQRPYGEPEIAQARLWRPPGWKSSHDVHLEPVAGSADRKSPDMSVDFDTAARFFYGWPHDYVYWNSCVTDLTRIPTLVSRMAADPSQDWT